MNRSLTLTLLAAGVLFMNATAAHAFTDTVSGASLAREASTAAPSVEEATNKVAGLLNAGDYRTLERIYPELKDSLTPFLRDLSEAMIHAAFNRPAESNAAIDRLAAHPETDLELLLNMRVVSFFNYRSLNDYAGGARVLRTLLDELPDKEDASYASFEAFARWMDAFSAWPATTIRRPARDTEVPVEIRPMGRGETLLVKATMNGITRPFIFDTGCSGSNFVSEQIARELGIRILADSVPVTGMTTLPAKVGVADSLLFGEITLLHPTFIVIPDTLMHEMPGEIHAVLGNDLMNRLGEMRIEANRGRIVFPAEETALPAEGPNMTCSGGQFYLWPERGEETMLFHFDTGNVKSTLTDYFYTTHKRMVKKQGRKSTSTQGGFGGKKELSVYVLPEFRMTLGGVPFCLRDVTVNIREDSFPTESVSESGSLGADFLRAFDAVTVNFRRMFVQPRNDEPEQ